MFDLCRNVAQPIRDALTAAFSTPAEPPPVLYVGELPDKAARPYLWLRPGPDLPPPRPAIRAYRLSEVLLDFGAVSEGQLYRMERAVVFLSGYETGRAGAARAVRFSPGRRLSAPDALGVKMARSYEVSWLDAGLASGLAVARA